MNNLIKKIELDPIKIVNIFAIILPIITCLLNGTIILIFDWDIYILYLLNFPLIIYFILMGVSIKIKNIKKYNIYNLIICIVLFIFIFPILKLILPFFIDRPVLDGVGAVLYVIIEYLPCVIMGIIDIISLIICFFVYLIKKIRRKICE